MMTLRGGKRRFETAAVVVIASVVLAAAAMLSGCPDASLLGLVADADEDPSETNPETYTVSYNANGASGGTLPLQSSHSYDDEVWVSEAGELRGPVLGFGITQRFLQWNTQADAGGSGYLPFEAFGMPDHDVTLYAIWTTDGGFISKIGPAGGLVFFEHAESNGDWRFLEAAPPETEWTGRPWSEFTTLVDGTEIGIGAGEPNTQAIVGAMGDGDYAAKLCDDLSHGGYSDWFLPSIDELNLMYHNVQWTFAPAFYWSSSEENEGLARAQKFNDGSRHPESKTNAYRVRAARAF